MTNARPPAPAHDDAATGAVTERDPAGGEAPLRGATARDSTTLESPIPRWGTARPRSRLWLACAALLWLLLPTADVLASGTGVTEEVLSLAALAAFGAAFLGFDLTVSSLERPQPTRVTWLCTAVLAAVAVLLPLLRRDIEWTSLQVYCTAILAFVLPLRYVPIGITAGVAMAGLQGVVRGGASRETLSATLTVFGIGMAMWGLRRSRVLVRQLRNAQGEVARLAAVEERLRIARDLHDLVGHSLSLIVVKSELAGRLAAAGLPAAAREMADVETVARKSLVEVRDAVTGYRRLSLADELADARSALAAAGVDTVLRPPADPLPAELDQVFGWAVREGVTNVIRHAAASRCEIAVTRDAGTARLDVTDDGRGPHGAGGDRQGTHRADSGGPGAEGTDDEGHGHAHGTDPYSGNGLKGLAERVEEAHGTVTAGPATRGGRGFRLSVRVPIPPAPDPDPGPASAPWPS
ncbi:sensor histidine kinase [Streptomyces sp. TS71-3]|uniref:sensor histidine kinase n=1 Tax=Streptomyces sp. TS71-3 TaxID=2733862 RepID=UPI001B013FFD|nr:sensor histidine kinase [Streptomyces sp. TS71-3]GHJ37417.1 two-component sensor histidine kinase [Streptomyces sp. TS71-3]